MILITSVLDVPPLLVLGYVLAEGLVARLVQLDKTPDYLEESHRLLVPARGLGLYVPHHHVL